MPIKQITPRAAIERAVEQRVERLLSSLIKVLCYVGEEVVKYARDPKRSRYIDRTGNLTSSIGYVVLWEGEVVQESNFKSVKGTDSKKPTKLSGSKAGRDFLHQLIDSYSDGLVLIVVAGMPYAAYVEALGYDVLDSAEIKAGELIKKFMSKLRF